MSLDELALPPEEQAQVEQIQADLLIKMRPAADTERNLAALLAEGIASTALDAANIARALDALAATSATAQASAVADLDRLHALLTPAQRSALNDKLDAQWALWKRANVGDQGYAATISKEIGLWPAQIDKLQEQLGSGDAAAPLRQEEIEARLHDFETAFGADNFNATSLSTAHLLTGQQAGWGASRIARFCEAVNPLLVPEQRNRLVALLREHAAHNAETQGKE